MLVFNFSSPEGHLSWLQILALVNGTAVNTEFRYLFPELNSISFRHVASNGVSASYSASTFHFLRNVHTVSHNGCSGQRVLIFMNVTIWRRGENIFLSWCFSDWVGKEQEMGLCVLSLSHLLAHSYFRKTWKIIGSYSVGCLCCPARLHHVLSINTVAMFTHSCGELPVPARLSGTSIEGAEFWLCDIYVLD